MLFQFLTSPAHFPSQTTLNQLHFDLQSTPSMPRKTTVKRSFRECAIDPLTQQSEIRYSGTPYFRKLPHGLSTMQGPPCSLQALGLPTALRIFFSSAASHSRYLPRSVRCHFCHHERLVQHLASFKIQPSTHCCQATASACPLA